MKTKNGPVAFLNLLLSTLIMAAAPVAAALEVRLPATHPGMRTVKPGGSLAKLDGPLLKVHLEFADHQRTAPGTAFRPRNPFLKVDRGRILVDAHAATDANNLLADLDRLGMVKGSRFGDTVSGWLPLGVMRQAAALDSLRALSASIPMTNTGSVTSQGDAAQRSDVARTSHNVSGAGVKVGVLSDSFDHQEGAATDVASGDLPNGVDVRDDSATCVDIDGPTPCTDEGRAMLQIVHDVAPGAALTFHTAFNGFAGFANGIVDLANAGARVITDDVIYLGEPMFMDGVIAKAVDQVKGMGVAYFSAAGNQARDSYEHAFVNSGEQLYIDIGIGPPVAAGFMHDFDPSPVKDTMQAHTIPAGQCAIFSVQWDSPFGSAALGTGTQNDLDVWLVDESESSIVAYDAHENIPTGEPVEIMQFCNDGLFAPTTPPVFKLIIALWDGTAPGLMKTVLFGSASIDEHATNSGTSYGHANAAGAEAVGAAYYQATPEFGTAPPQLESFSSAGGTPILFAANGTRLAAPELRLKPEIVAPDGVNTTFFYPTSDRNGDGIPDFSGTSAAAPHAAGVAALMLEKDAAATPDSVYAALESTAIDMMAAGFDYDSGHGLIQADQAVSTIATANAPPVASFTYSCNGLTCSFDGSASSDPDGTITSYAWDFGDGATAAGAAASHTYATAGTYNVTLTVTDDNGASDSATNSVAAVAIKATGFVSPTANAPVMTRAGDNNGFEVNPASAHADDGSFAVDNNSGTSGSTSCTDRRKDKHDFFTFDLPIAGSIIKGIEVRLDAKVDSVSGSPKMCVQLSWDGGNSWTAAKSTPLTASEASHILGGNSDTWGHAWNVGELSNLRVRVVDVAGSTARDFSLDWVAVQVTYQ